MDEIIELVYNLNSAPTAFPLQDTALSDPLSDQDISITMVQQATHVSAIAATPPPAPHTLPPSPPDTTGTTTTYYQSDEASPGTRCQPSPAGLLSLSQIKLEPDDNTPVQAGTTVPVSTIVPTSNVSMGGTGTTVPSTGAKVKKKGAGVAGKSIEEELCLICGDRASGYHYNALSCEGCKGFFRRSITRGATYTCKYGGHCEMDMWMRRRCQSCRLRRCREVGMKEECLLSEDQCKARDVRRKARQRLQKAQLGIEPDADNQQSPDSNTNSSATDIKRPISNPLDYVTTENRELIECIVYYQDKYELPTEEDLKKVSNVQISDEGRPKDMSSSVYKMVAEMTILTTQLVVEFAKHLPGFNTINRDDQIILLKGSASEVMVLRTARRYDIHSKSVILGNGMPMNKESMKLVGLHDYVDSLFVFCHKMAELGVDNAEYALITAMCLLTERPGLTDPRHVDNLHDMYLNALLDYQRYRRVNNSHFLAKLIMKFTELRTVSQIHSDSLYNLRLEKGSLPPLLSEYFDIDKE